MTARVLPLARLLGVVAALALVLLAAGPVASSSAQTAGPADDMEQMLEQSREFLNEVQTRAEIFASYCDQLRGPATQQRCTQDAQLCVYPTRDTGACARLAFFCQRIAACAPLLPPLPDGRIFQFTTDWAEWLTSYFNPLTQERPRTHRDIYILLQAAAFALLGLYLTYSLLHYWSTGLLSTGSPAELVTAPLRAVGAAFAILISDTVFYNGMQLGDRLVDLLIGVHGENTGGALRALDGLFNTAEAFKPLIPGPDIPVLPGLSDLISLLLGLAVSLTVLALSASKVGVDFSLFLLSTAMPLAFALWVLPGTSWLASSAVRAVVALTLVPLGWALTLVIFSSVATDMTDQAAAGSFVQSLAGPLVGIVLLLMLFTVMRQILSWGRVVPGGSRPLGAAWGAVMGAGYMGMHMIGMGARMANSAMRHVHLPRRTPRQQNPPTPGTGVVLSPRPSGGGGGGAGGNGPIYAHATRMDRPDPQRPAPGPQQLGASPRAWSMPDKGDRNLHGDGLRMAYQDGRPSVYSEPVNMEFQASRHRLSEQGTPSEANLASARQSLPVEQQQWLQRVSQTTRPEMHLAQQAARPLLDPAHRDAYRTLLDGAHAQDRSAFLRVAQQPPSSGGGSANGKGGP